jgi:uncharacterized protein with HEPN domain
MSPSIKNDLMHLLNILESIEKILLYTKDFDNADSFYESFEQLNFNASLSLLLNIGEIIDKLSEELKKKYDKISWQEINDVRNRIAHDYHGLDIYIIFDIITYDIITLKESINKIIEFEIKQKTFDFEELTAAKNSYFYRHIDFSLLL